jgi:outer membrane protein assembly factor BamB
MKKAIVRNIAIVSAVFIVAFATMLVTNYFQVKDATPLQTEVMETLKEINDQNANNPAIQAQIRQLDLLARRAYFVNENRLMAGVYILLGMLGVFLACLHLYFAKDKHIPAKQVAPIDEWISKTQARRYIGWVGSAVAAVALVFVVLSTPYLRSPQTPETVEQAPETTAETVVAPVETPPTEVLAEAEAPETPPVETVPTEDVATTAEQPSEAAPTAVSAVTHNEFRGNRSNGISAAKRAPVQWDLSSGTHIAWRAEVPRQGFNSPVINGNRVFLSGADDSARELYCYDMTSGALLWSLAADNIPGSPAQMPKTTADTGLAASTVATNGKQVCAIFATGDILCADMDGKRLWAKNLGVPDNHYGYASSLLIYGNTVIVQYDNQNTPKVLALDLANGNERWSKTRTEKVTWSSPMIAMVGNTAQLVLMGNPAITAYNPSDGQQLWRVECFSGEVGSSPASANGIIYGASEYSKLIAINGNDGSVVWESTEFLPEVSSPAATSDNLYLATSYGVVAAYNAQTGELRKEHELTTPFYSSPVIVEGKVYLFDVDGKAYIFSADNDFNILHSFETGEPTFATPAFTDGKMVVRTDKSLYCVNAE